MLQTNNRLPGQRLARLGRPHEGFTQPVAKQQAGFTIIEVLIVLAIAGLILLIVFLAVPALQRNGRNTTYRNEASRLMAAAQEYMSRGTVPTALSSCSGTGTGATECGNIVSPTESQQIWQLAKPKNIITFTIRASTSTGPMTPLLTAARFQTGAKCGTQGAIDYSIVGSGSKNAVLVYAVEDTGGSVVPQCIDV